MSHRFSTGLISLFLSFSSSVVFAATVSQTISSGSLTVSAPSSVTFSSVSISFTNQTATGSITPVAVSDFRGSGPGWNLVLSSQHLTFTGSMNPAVGNTSPLPTLNSLSRYNGTCGVTSPNTTYTVTVATGGSIGTATYSVTGGCGDTNQTNVLMASTANDVGSRGVKIDFPAGTYVAGDQWSLGIDVYPFTGLKIIPGTPSAAEAGSDLTGVNASSSGFLNGTGSASDSRSILTADSGKGMGAYNQTVNLELSVHPGSFAGTFTGSITLTVF